MDQFMCSMTEYNEAAAVLFGAPFDGTTSYRPGTRFAGQYIRNESYGIEDWSPYKDKSLEAVRFFDSGDLPLPFGNTEKVLEIIEDYTDKVLNDGKLPIMIGGEHLVTLGAVKSVFKKYPNLNIIQFDAHADLRDEYLGEKLSHACVIRRCFDLMYGENGREFPFENRDAVDEERGDIPERGRIYQFGIRSGTMEEFSFANNCTKMRKFDFEGLLEVCKSLEGKPVYFTLDLDVLDPSVFPGTGTPEPGGVSFNDLLNAIYTVCFNTHVVGADMTELSPPYDPSGISTITACKLIREMLIALHYNMI